MDTYITNVNELINQAKKNGWKYCLYGAGKLSRAYGYELMSYMGMVPHYICDANEKVLEDFPGNAQKIGKDSLMQINEDVLVFVCLGIAYIRDACEELDNNPNLHIIDLDSYLAEDSVLSKFYGINIYKNAETCPRIAVFTCITGGYDEPITPKYISNNCDYYLISDANNRDCTSICKYIDVSDVVPEKNLSDKQKNRYCKTHGNVIFKEYDYSIYVDGSIEIIGDISSYIKYCNRATGLAMLRHPWRDCIYEEGIRIAIRNIVDNEKLKRLFCNYYSEGMPRHFGLFECSVIVSFHKNKIGNDILEKWYKEFMKHGLRDQFSLPYVLWKEGLNSDVIGLIEDGNNVRNSMVAKKVVNH